MEDGHDNDRLKCKYTQESKCIKVHTAETHGKVEVSQSVSAKIDKVVVTLSRSLFHTHTLSHAYTHKKTKKVFKSTNSFTCKYCVCV